MTRTFLLLAVCALLAGCESREESRARNEAVLPPGCKIIDLDYGELRAAVVCDGRKSTTQLREWQETIMTTVSDAKGNITMTPTIYYYSSMSATIEPRS